VLPEAVLAAGPVQPPAAADLQTSAAVPVAATGQAPGAGATAAATGGRRRKRGGEQPGDAAAAEPAAAAGAGPNETAAPVARRVRGRRAPEAE
jgi:hypothetical protein